MAVICFGFLANAHAIDKNLPAKIHDTCDIMISEEDCCTKLVCRKCEAFVSKVSEFKRKSQNIQIEFKMEQKCSVKHCTELSLWGISK